MMMKVKFLPQNVEYEIETGESVLELAKRTGVFVKSLCGGMPSCAECRVRIVEGSHNVMPPGTKEKSLIGSAYFIDHSRLSCQVKCMGDITVDLTEQIQKQNAPPVAKKPRQPMKKRERPERAGSAASNQSVPAAPTSDSGANEPILTSEPEVKANKK